MARTKLVRMYVDDWNEVKMKFPNVKIADFIHMSARTNPFVQVEAVLRGKRYAKK